MDSAAEGGIATVIVDGEALEHPALRRLARACIGLARWRRRPAVSAAAGGDGEDDAAAPPTGGRS